MIKLLRVAVRLRRFCMVSAWGIAVAIAPLHAQEPPVPSASNNPAVATNGATLIHGNYCGAGNRPGTPPIDALDLACMNHDACSPTGGIPNCDCNARLRDEAAAVAADPRQAPELRSLASLTAAAATMMICKPMLKAATPAVASPPVASAPVSAAAPDVAAPVAAAPVAVAPATAPPVAVAPVDRASGASAPISIVPSTVAQAPESPAPPAQVSVAPATVAPTAGYPASAVPASASPSVAAPAPGASSLP
jgi:hypothetical protein